MDELFAIREEINEIDTKMVALFEQRMSVAERVASYKKANDKPVYDKAREEIVVQSNLQKLQSDTFKDLYADWLLHTMELSRVHQMRVLSQDTVAFQGVRGAYSHIALQKIFPYAKQYQCESFADVFNAVKNDEAYFGVLPFENSFAGDVSEVLDLCNANDLHVVDMYDLPISHSLLAINGAQLNDIKEIYSHSQALAQCERYTKSLNVKIFPYANTALAAKYVSECGDKTKAAIASTETAELYGLNVLAQGINTSTTNTTRFIVISKQAAAQGNGLSLLFTVSHEPGSLAAVVAAISALNYNMECIKSRPMPNKPWQYYFYAELAGSVDNSAQLVQKLSTLCHTMRILGVYNK